MEAEGMGALLAVARGSDEEPRLMVLEHRGGKEGEKPLVLVGKGLTFDAGGISIKPAAGMEDMKFDMCGGAAVLGAMHAIGELEVKANVVGIVPSSENLLGARAMKPGDIFRASSGTTIEVVNTDAEGRLILADALVYARRFDPAAVLDAATLTGACVVALGHTASGILGNDDALLDEVRAAGERTGERCWPLPMFDEYRDLIKSDYADIKNSGGRPAGTISAAWFLREFVGDFPWVHLDVAGTAYGDGKLSYQAKGSTGAPTRLFVDWVRSRAG
jgi:leucyl aminopeptidase